VGNSLIFQHPPRRPPITKTYTRRPKQPIPITTSSASPDTLSHDDFTNNDESCAISDETQVDPPYNLRNRATIHPPDKLGFQRASAAV